MRAQVGRPRLPSELEFQFWDRVRAGLTTGEAAADVGVSTRKAQRWFRDRGGVMPPAQTGHRRRSLSFAEREQIGLLRAAGGGVREIARQVGRDPATISRELRRVVRDPRARGGQAYLPSLAQDHADRQLKRPKPTKLATNLPLRREVQKRLRKNHSPEQIAARLREEFPDDPEMRVSHETIYQALYVQGRGALKRELVKHLRTGRAVRKPRRSTGERRGRIAGMVNISERPKEVEDRAVPGDWEGDLILGSTASGSAIGTLVERATGFVLLLHLPGNHTADTVSDAMIAKMTQLPEQLLRSVTWDQGAEMAGHLKIAEATGLDVYFCDPHSPWQRGTNENTNGLLRQYFPKGTDLSRWGPGYLDNVADEVNERPRKRLGWKTPAEALAALLSEQSDPPGVATTA